MHPGPPHGDRGAATTNVRSGDRGYGVGGSSTAEPQMQNGRAARSERHRDALEQPLHPSWEAKKKQKAKESAAIVPSQGTKMTFT